MKGTPQKMLLSWQCFQPKPPLRSVLITALSTKASMEIRIEALNKSLHGD